MSTTYSLIGLLLLLNVWNLEVQQNLSFVVPQIQTLDCPIVFFSFVHDLSLVIDLPLGAG